MPAQRPGPSSYQLFQLRLQCSWVTYVGPVPGVLGAVVQRRLLRKALGMNCGQPGFSGLSKAHTRHKKNIRLCSGSSFLK